jgi:hypothetical protein
MSQWLQENIIKNLNAFQLVILILGYFILSPFVTVFTALLMGDIVPTLYHVLIFGFFCLVVSFFIMLALGVYNKDKEAKIETSKIVEFSPTEKFTLKQAANMLFKLAQVQSEPVVPTPEEDIDLSCIPEAALKTELIRRIGDEQHG